MSAPDSKTTVTFAAFWSTISSCVPVTVKVEVVPPGVVI
jgi:hypothetical protein